MLLESINEPRDLQDLDHAALRRLAAEIRDELVTSVAHTGGHIGPNLGCVELTIALHRVFRSPYDRILFDTGHQTYVHKLLTGRHGRFGTLRQSGGLSGYPSRNESDHDIIENSHASTALSYADGLAKAHQLAGEDDRRVVAVIGDGALTGGMAWEALNNIAAAPDRPVVVVVNDNGRSYSPTAGGLAEHLMGLRLSHRYERLLKEIRSTLSRTPSIGRPTFEVLRRAKRGLKELVVPQSLFCDIGIKYVGPIDGHDLRAVEQALVRAKEFAEPVVVHCVTRKGHGYPPAENDATDCLHGPGPFDPRTGRQQAKKGTSWSAVFGDALVELGRGRDDVVAITAAMLHPTGLGPFHERFPERVFDVGIAEQHAVTSAAGLATGGYHPVVALYATFLNRAFDQVLMDVALHRLPVTFALDRAGVTGDDGPSHNGMWDLSILQVVPGLSIAVPRDAPSLRRLLDAAIAIDDGPSLLRYPKGIVGPDLPAYATVGSAELLTKCSAGDVLIVAVGPMAEIAVDAHRRLAEADVTATVVDPCWVRPFDDALALLVRDHRAVIVVEDNCVAAGVGDSFAAFLRQHRTDRPLRVVGIPARFPDHGKRPHLLAEFGMTGEDIADGALALLSSLEPDAARGNGVVASAAGRLASAASD